MRSMSCKFDSHNDLFKHMNQEGHVVASDGKDNDNEHVNRVESSRGRKKVSRSDRRHKQLYIHRNQNIEKVDNIDEWMESHGWEKNELTNY